MAHGGSQARGQIGAIATGLRHTALAMSDLSLVCDLHHSSWQCRILNPLSETGIELATSWFLVRFVSAVPEWELLGKYFKVCFSKLGICFIIPLEYMQNFD